MKQLVFGIVTVCLLISCQAKVTEKDLDNINGYWEIETVQLPDGNQKDYTINETIDYFELKDKAGIRRKVMPQLDGKFIVSPQEEKITVVDSNGVFYIHYQTDYAKWKEAVIAISDSVLVLKNDQKLEYHYKKHQPIIIP